MKKLRNTFPELFLCYFNTAMFMYVLFKINIHKLIC